MGIVRPEWELSPRPAAVPAWTSLHGHERERLAESMATYAAMVEIMDRNVGRVVGTLEKHGALDDTVILFLSDNGACAEGPTMGSQALYGECWAHLSNTPLRLYKHFTMQGGVQTSCIGHWPSGMSTRGRISDWTGSLYDIMPTCLDLAGAEYPGERNGKKLHPLDGTSLLPALTGAEEVPNTSAGEGGGRGPGPGKAGKPTRRDIFIEHEGNQMLRRGQYKAVRQHSDEYWQLYDMEADRTETHNLSGVMPDRLIELAHRYYEWERGAHIIPWAIAGRNMTYHGYGRKSGTSWEAFEKAIAAAPPDEVVDGDAIGDGESI